MQSLAADATILAIRLDEPETECIACGVAPIPVRQGLPMRDGHVIENDDDTAEWGGFSACRECWWAHHEGGGAGLNARLRALGVREL